MSVEILDILAELPLFSWLLKASGSEYFRNETNNTFNIFENYGHRLIS